jgi:hypothetical protein
MLPSNVYEWWATQRGRGQREPDAAHATVPDFIDSRHSAATHNRWVVFIVALPIA